jgi:UDP-glucose 4-epimerase
VKVLVTGAAGFIAGYVVPELLAAGYEVVGLDDFSKYGYTERSYDSHPNYHFTYGDASDPAVVTKLLDGCDHFIAGAAKIGGIGYFHAFPYDLLAGNERLTAAAGDAAKAAYQAGRLQKVTWISSSMVYESATRDQLPSVEGSERQIAPPISSYGFAKLAVEYFARTLEEQYGVPYTILRPFNCVGTGEAGSVHNGDGIHSRCGGPGNLELGMSHVVPDLVRKVLQGQDPLHILGTGQQVRHYTYGGDLARGIVASLTHPDALNEDFNLSSPVPTRVLELAWLISLKITGREPNIAHDEPFEHDVQWRMPSTDKAEKVLGWTAETSLSAMLDEVIPWVRDAMTAGKL